MKMIKNSIVLFILLISTAKIYSQELLVKENKLWNVVDEYMHMTENGHYRGYSVKFYSDTLIGGKVYKKVWETTSIDTSIWNHVAYIREDSSHKVYCMNKKYKEGLIYDFNANVGDSLVLFNPLCGYRDMMAIVVEKKDTLIYDKTRKIFKISFYGADTLGDYNSLSSNIPKKGFDVEMKDSLIYEKIRNNVKMYFYSEDWIEGIGCTLGVVENISYELVGTQPSILCYYENNELAYKNPKYSSCSYLLDIKEKDALSDKILLYYDNVQSQLNVKIPDDYRTNILNLEIYDASGNVVCIEEGLISKNEMNVSMQNHQSGIYFYKIYYAANILATGKFVKL